MVNSWMMPVTVATDGLLVWVGGCWSKSKQRSSISEIVPTQVCCRLVKYGWRFAYLCQRSCVLTYVRPLFLDPGSRQGQEDKRGCNCKVKQEINKPPQKTQTMTCVTNLDTRAPLSLASSFFARLQQNILIQVYWNEIQSPVGVSRSYFVSRACL